MRSFSKVHCHRHTGSLVTKYAVERVGHTVRLVNGAGVTVRSFFSLSDATEWAKRMGVNIASVEVAK